MKEQEVEMTNITGNDEHLTLTSDLYMCRSFYLYLERIHVFIRTEETSNNMKEDLH